MKLPVILYSQNEELAVTFSQYLLIRTESIPINKTFYYNYRQDIGRIHWPRKDGQHRTETQKYIIARCPDDIR